MRDNLACGVVEPAISKIKSLRFATEAAITILRIGEHVLPSQRSVLSGNALVCLREGRLRVDGSFAYFSTRVDVKYFCCSVR